MNFDKIPLPLHHLVSRLSPGAAGLQLVAAHDGFTLWLALTQFDKGIPLIQAVANSNATDFNSAIGEAKRILQTQTRSQGLTLPKHLNMASSAAIPGLLDLPIDANKTRKDSEMESMIRWEMEAPVADYNELWSLGAILVGRQLVTREQRHNIAVELEIRRDSSSGGLSRYGEVAIDLGLIDQEQLQECLKLQEKLVALDTDFRCGWQLQTIIEEESTHHLWLASAIDLRIRRQWTTAFAQNGLKLNHYCPFVGAGLGTIPHLTEQSSVLMLEIHHESLAAYRLDKNQLASLQTQHRVDSRPLEEQCFGLLLEQMRSGVDAVLIVGNVESDTSNDPELAPLNEGANTESTVEQTPIALLAKQLSDRFQRPVTTIPDLSPNPAAVGNNIPQLAVLALTGTVAQLKKTDVTLGKLPTIASKDPAPPIWKNQHFYRYGIPAALVIALIGHGIQSSLHSQHLGAQLDKLDKEYKASIELNKKASALNNKSKKAEDTLEQKQMRLAKISHDLDLIENKVMARGRLAPKLLKAIADSVDNSVMLDSIIEPRAKSKNSFNIKAWALDNTSASTFSETLQQSIQRLGYRVADPDIRAGIGRYGLRGYTIDLWIVPQSSAKNLRGTANEILD